MSQRNRQIVRNFRQLPVKCQVIAEKEKNIEKYPGAVNNLVTYTATLWRYQRVIA